MVCGPRENGSSRKNRRKTGKDQTRTKKTVKAFINQKRESGFAALSLKLDK